MIAVCENRLDLLVGQVAEIDPGKVGIATLGGNRREQVRRDPYTGRP